MKCVACHMSHIACHMSHIACHLSPVTNVNSHSQRPPPPLLTPQLYTVDWFTKPKKTETFFFTQKLIETRKEKIENCVMAGQS